ncbi:hypothetical protein DCAR_0414713 [Daucus carota subsp. sativus]|uniref:Uncharacterized protein n=1 Tax=Daucus carota subsp. sativus TaxID=79200 RepID=A0A164ZZ52_DAUCS|nr:hypothetical protein DCAR_0414713 [Daucus carota subsp. sativus]
MEVRVLTKVQVREGMRSKLRRSWRGRRKQAAPPRFWQDRRGGRLSQWWSGLWKSRLRTISEMVIDASNDINLLPSPKEIDNRRDLDVAIQVLVREEDVNASCLWSCSMREKVDSAFKCIKMAINY